MLRDDPRGYIDETIREALETPVEIREKPPIIPTADPRKLPGWAIKPVQPGNRRRVENDRE